MPAGIFRDIDRITQKQQEQTFQQIEVENQEIPAFVKEIGEEIIEISGTWNPVELVAPDAQALAKEQERFLDSYAKGQEYNPVFQYHNAQAFNSGDAQKLDKIIHRLKKLKTNDPQSRLFRIALIYKVKDDLSTCQIAEGIQSQDDSLVKKGLTRKYSALDETTLNLAHQNYQYRLETKNRPDRNEAIKPELTPAEMALLRSRNYSAADMKTAADYVLQHYGLDRTSNPNGFETVISADYFDPDVRDKSIQPLTYFVPANLNLDAESFIGTLEHEISGHARQSMNGREMFFIGGGQLKIDDEVLYEGYAKDIGSKIVERLFGTFPREPLPYYPLAVEKANQGYSFYKIFEDQHRLTSQLLSSEKALEQAWKNTRRIMRGHVDMTNQHAFANNKDLAYLKGYWLHKQLNQAGFGVLNEVGVAQTEALQLLARLNLANTQLPYPYTDPVGKYVKEVLLPQLQNNQ